MGADAAGLRHGATGASATARRMGDGQGATAAGHEGDRVGGATCRCSRAGAGAGAGSVRGSAGGATGGPAGTVACHSWKGGAINIDT